MFNYKKVGGKNSKIRGPITETITENYRDKTRIGIEEKKDKNQSYR